MSRLIQSVIRYCQVDQKHSQHMDVSATTVLLLFCSLIIPDGFPDKEDDTYCTSSISTCDQEATSPSIDLPVQNLPLEHKVRITTQKMARV